MRKIGAIAGVVVAAVTLFLIGGIGAWRGGDLANEPGPALAGVDALTSPATPSGVGTAIEALRERTSATPADWRAHAALGLAYVQQARIVGDPTTYELAEAALDRSLRIRPADNPDAFIGLGSLSAARHNFGTALRYGRDARAITPHDATVFGVIGDAQLELGHYRAAFATFQRMVDLEPGIASYARVSYARELVGDLRGAVLAMRTAREFASTPADVAWTSHRLGELALGRGRLRDAARAFKLGLSADPASTSNLAGLGQVAWARGDLDRAIDRYQQVVARYPSPEHVATLGDLSLAVGDREAARDEFALVATEIELFEASGGNADLQLALYLADHGRAAEALRAARAEWRRRTSVHVADALAWALHVSGRDAEASRYARRALALGGRPALFLYHAGMIERALGHRADARDLLRESLDLNPYFSVRHVPLARAALDSLSHA